MNPTSPALPPRCTAEEIAVVLRDVARPASRVVVNSKVQEWGESAVWVTTDQLWKVGLWRQEGALQMTLEAVSPDRRHWQWGCQRRWLEDGGVIEPLELLSEQERQALDERLLRAVALPSTGICPMWTPSVEAAAQKPDKAKGKKRRRSPKAGQSS